MGAALLLLADVLSRAVIAPEELPVGVVTAVLGGGYGMALISGLLNVQRIAGPDDLAGLTAVFYGLTYLGFASPAIMAAIFERYDVGYPAMLIFGAVVAIGSLVVVLVSARSSGVVAAVRPHREEDVLLDRSGQSG